MKISFRIEYRTQWGESIGLTIGGNDGRLIMLTTTNGVIWEGTCEIELPAGGIPVLYRYGVYRDGVCVRREQAAMPHILPLTKKKSIELNDEWRDPKRVAGTAVPVFALRSEGGFGIGDFGDLKRLIDWAVITHQGAVQILPINDTTITGTWTDSYPYNSISIYAYHPQYIDLRQLPALKNEEEAKAFEAKRIKLNALLKIDYEEVNNTKRAYLRAIFKQEGKKILGSAGFKTFFDNNSEWLRPYAAFSVLRDKYGTPDYTQWAEHSVYKADEINAFTDKNSEAYSEVAFYYFLQYELHIQLLDASNYAREKNVILKGDIPIGISRQSVEAWVEPFYFNMNGQAGAPPDPFSKNGQNWGFPTYNWDVMQKDGLKWWLKRFRKMAEYFSAYRIDHILGFFRIWEIPMHSVHGLLGQFSPALPMSPQEIESYGLHFQKDFMTKPFINEELLQKLFRPEFMEFIKSVFVVNVHHDIYEMRPEFNTQRKVEAYFKGKNGANDVEIKEALYSLISNVLFVPDHKNPSLYHPRICAQDDYIFSRLQGYEKDAFNRLYVQYFYHRHNQFWYEEAMKKLPRLIDATQMIVCGEDLGMVPDCVPWVMNQLQILSLEIQSMPKNPAHDFGVLSEYPWRSVCTISSHDTSTFRGWWEENREITQRFYNNVLHRWGEAPEKATGDIVKQIVNEHLNSPSLLCILALQDWLGIDENIRYPEAAAERINVPANPRHYWRFRMHISLEKLMSEYAFNEEIRQMIDNSNR